MGTKSVTLQTAPLAANTSSHDMYDFVTSGATGLQRSRLSDPFHYGETTVIEVTHCSEFPHFGRQHT